MRFILAFVFLFSISCYAQIKKPNQKIRSGNSLNTTKVSTSNTMDRFSSGSMLNNDSLKVKKLLQKLVIPSHQFLLIKYLMKLKDKLHLIRS